MCIPIELFQILADYSDGEFSVFHKCKAKQSNLDNPIYWVLLKNSLSQKQMAWNWKIDREIESFGGTKDVFSFFMNDESAAVGQLRNPLVSNFVIS